MTDNHYRTINVAGLDRRAPQSGRPELCWIPIEAIRIDEVYQREISHRGWSQIKRIAANFQWASFSPVLASRITGDRFALIDGQHRTHAALLAGYDEVPGLVVEVDQAAAFARVNADVTKITIQAVFKAALAAGEAWAKECDKVVAAAGCELMRTNKSATKKLPGEVFAIAVIRDMVRNMEGSAVTAGLKALIESDAGSQDAELFASQILRPWLQALATNSVYIKLDLTRALNESVDLYFLYEQATRAAKQEKVSRPPIFRRMIRQALDRYRRGRPANVVAMAHARTRH